MGGRGGARGRPSARDSQFLPHRLSPELSPGVLTPHWCLPSVWEKDEKCTPTRTTSCSRVKEPADAPRPALLLPSQISLEIRVSLSFAVPGRVIAGLFLGTELLWGHLLLTVRIRKTFEMAQEAGRAQGFSSSFDVFNPVLTH